MSIAGLGPGPGLGPGRFGIGRAIGPTVGHTIGLTFGDGVGEACVCLGGRHIGLGVRPWWVGRGQGGLGYSVPGAIGAAATRPDVRIVTVAGDGAFSYTLGELATQAQFNQRIVNVVINNGRLGWIQLWQEIFFKNVQSAILETQSVQPGFASAASALGLKGIYVDKPDEIGPALDAAFDHDGPSVVEVRIDDRATPIHSFKRRMREGSDKPRPRPGTVYKLRDWKVSPDL